VNPRPPRSSTALSPLQSEARRSHPVILVIHAASVHQRGHQFYRAAHGTWLSHVPPSRIGPHTPGQAGT